MINLLPNWLSHAKQHLSNDIIAGLIVGILVIPQSLGYALIAGLPPVYGLYAAIVPVLIYAWIGSSSAVAVGPVAIMAIMTAQALQPFQADPATHIVLAITLSLLAGCMLLIASWLKLGWTTQFISRGVTAGFVSAAGILIGLSQLKYVTGTDIDSHTLSSSVVSLWERSNSIHLPTLSLAAVALVVLLLARFQLKPLLTPYFSEKTASFLVRLAPLVVVIISIVASVLYGFSDKQIQIIQHIPQQLPPMSMPSFHLDTVLKLLPSAALIALIAFISSASLAGQFGRLRGETVDANKELKALGLSNIGGAFFSSFPTTGGFSRTAVNVDAGGKTPLASMVAALLMLAALLFLGKLLEPLPYAVLGASIMAAVVSLIDTETLKTALKTDRAEAGSFIVTFITTLLLGLNVGLVTGLLFSFASLIWRSSQPHIAIIGQIIQNGTETGHFRNVNRHEVRTYSNLLMLRIDESLFYGNSASVKATIESAIKNKPDAEHIILMLSAVNHIDLAAQDMLTELNQLIVEQGKALHLSEVKGPVMDRLKKTQLLRNLSGQVFLNTKRAVSELKIDDSPEYML